jgi:hypothetical protein
VGHAPAGRRAAFTNIKPQIIGDAFNLVGYDQVMSDCFYCEVDSRVQATVTFLQATKLARAR